MYALYFLVLFRSIRFQVMYGLTDQIWMTDMPNVERIYRLVMDVYLVREMGYFAIEEDLFAKLIFVMRSRELAIKYTRFRENPYNPDIIFDRERRQVSDKNQTVLVNDVSQKDV